jgi:hypothetical protein
LGIDHIRKMIHLGQAKFDLDQSVVASRTGSREPNLPLRRLPFARGMLRAAEAANAWRWAQATRWTSAMCGMVLVICKIDLNQHTGQRTDL